MLCQEQEARPTAEPREKVEDTKRRFQIVKLEERIAPHHGKCPRSGYNRHCPRDR